MLQNGQAPQGVAGDGFVEFMVLEKCTPLGQEGGNPYPSFLQGVSGTR